MNDATQILLRIESGDPGAAEELLPPIYNELRRLAAHQLAQEKPGQTLQPTALVHEAYLRLLGPAGAEQRWNSRGHFFGAAAEAMRRILIENARRKQRIKHGGDRSRVDVDEASQVSDCAVGRSVGLGRSISRLAIEVAGQGGTDQTPLFCRSDDGRGGGRNEYFLGNGQALLGLFAGLAVQRRRLAKLNLSEPSFPEGDPMSAKVADVDGIFCAAIEIESPEKRAEYVDRACGADAELSLRVGELLAAHLSVGEFLDAHLRPF